MHNALHIHFTTTLHRRSNPHRAVAVAVALILGTSVSMAQAPQPPPPEATDPVNSN